MKRLTMLCMPLMAFSLCANEIGPSRNFIIKDQTPPLRLTVQTEQSLKTLKEEVTSLSDKMGYIDSRLSTLETLPETLAKLSETMGSMNTYLHQTKTPSTSPVLGVSEPTPYIASSLDAKLDLSNRSNKALSYLQSLEESEELSQANSDWSWSAEWLHWKVEQQASAFVTHPKQRLKTSVDPTIPITPSVHETFEGRWKHAPFAWHSGARFKLGYGSESKWKTLAQYTFYHTRGNTTVQKPNDTELYLHSAFLIPNKDFVIQKATADVDFHYHVGDLLLSHKFNLGSRLDAHLFAGATGAFIKENWTNIYTNTSNQSTKTLIKWDFKGGGVRSGIDTRFELGQGFGISSQLSLAGVVGSFNNAKTLSQETIANSLNPYSNIQDHTLKVIPNTQLALGLDWKSPLPAWNFQIKCGFEMNTWYDLHQYYQNKDHTSAPSTLAYRDSSNVTLWGANVGIQLNF
jgi:hypothetical protein